MEDAALERAERGLGPDPASVFAVLVVLPGGLGNVLKAVPALRHLRHLYSRAKITIAAEPAMHELLAGCPFVDRTIDAGRPTTLSLEQFDIAVSFDGLAEPFAARRDDVLPAVRAGTRVGWRRQDQEPALEVHPVFPARWSQAGRMARLAWLLGGERRSPELGLWPRLVDRNAAAALVEPWSDAPLAVLHAAAGSESRSWPAAGFAAVADLLHARGMHTLLVGVAPDRPLHEEIVARAQRRAVTDLSGRTTVGMLAGLLERAALFVGVDSGPATLAAALGTRSVVIGPGSAVEQLGSPARVSWISAVVAPDQQDGQLPAARYVDQERVLAAVALAAHRATREWRATRL